MAHAVCPATRCLAESLRCEPTVLSISLVHHHHHHHHLQTTLPLLKGKKEQSFWRSVPWLSYRYKKALLLTVTTELQNTTKQICTLSSFFSLLFIFKHAGEFGRQWSQRSAQAATATVNHWWERYEEFVGLNEVREAQTKVTEVSKNTASEFSLCWHDLV